MAKAMGWCIPCKERGSTVQAVAVVDGDGLCGVCLRTATKPVGSVTPVGHTAAVPVYRPTPIDPCSRGCDKPPHRGACVGGRKTVAPAPPQPDAPKSEFGAVAAKIDGFLGKPEELPPVVAAPLPEPQQMTEQERKRRMDKLVSKRVRIADIPAEATERSPTGRIGELWLKVTALPPGEAECVENVDVPHAGYTMRHMMIKARKAKVDLRCRRVGLQLYFWVGKGEAA